MMISTTWKTLFLIALFPSFVCALSEKLITYSYQTVSVPQYINAIAADSVGNLWVAGRTGLSKYDGSTWKMFTMANSGIPFSEINCIAVDHQNNVWIGGGLGLAKFDNNKWVYYNTPNELPSLSVTALAVDWDNNIWIGTGRGVSRYTGNAWIQYTAGLIYPEIWDIAVDSKNNIWFATGAGVSCFSNQNWTTYTNYTQWKEYAYLRPWRISIDPDDNVWIHTSEGYFIYNGANWQKFALPERLNLNYSCMFEMEDAYGNWWYYSSGYAFLRRKGENWAIFHEEASNSYPKNLAVTRDGHVWLARDEIIQEYGVFPSYPKLSLIPENNINFGRVIVRQGRHSNLNISNSGDTILVVALIIDNTDFSINSPQIEILPNRSVSVDIKFMPSKIGKFASTIHLTSNDPLKPALDLMLAGEGIIGPITHLFLPDVRAQNALYFPIAFPDSIRKLNIKVANTGDSELYLNSKINMHPEVFVLEQDKTTISPLDTADINISFVPTAIKEYFDTLWINATDTIIGISLYGNCIELPFFNSSSGNVSYRSNTTQLTIWAKPNYNISNATAKAYFSLDGGVTFENPLDCTFENGLFIALIPSQPQGTVVRYYFEVNDPVMGTNLLPSSAPRESFSLRVSYDADVNGDNKTDVFDLLYLLKNLSSGAAVVDVNKDGRFDIFDLLEMLKSLSAY